MAHSLEQAALITAELSSSDLAELIVAVRRASIEVEQLRLVLLDIVAECVEPEDLIEVSANAVQRVRR